MIALASLSPRSWVRGATSVAVPHVTAITQVTHDGYRKDNLLAGDSQIFVTEMPESNRVVARVTLPDSSRSLVASPFSSMQALDLSADHSKLLVSAKKESGDNELWVVPVSSGSPEPVGGLNGRDASWSADGKSLVYSKGHSLYLASATGAHERLLYKANGSVFAPRFSPNAQKIRFSVSDAEKGATSLWEVGKDGSQPHALLSDWPFHATACCGSWTSDGRYYIFQARQTVANTGLVLNVLWALSESKADVSAAAPIPLTVGPMSFGNPSVSRDGKNIWAIGVQPAVGIVKYEPHKKKYVDVIPGVSATDLQYSQDGKWVAYVTIPEGTLWRARANGKDQLQLTQAPDRAALPQWSPDGKQIAFAGMAPAGSWKLYRIPADGGDAKPLCSENGSQIDANWSSDGTQILFGDWLGDAGGLSIRLLDLKSNKIETIAGSKGFFSPRWSPNGQYIAAISPDSTTLMLFNFQTQKWTSWLKETAGTVSYPVWSNDSQYLYFDDLVNGAEAIRRINVDGSQPELVYEMPTIERYPGPFGFWSGRAPDGSWMVAQDRSTQEVYQLSMELP